MSLPGKQLWLSIDSLLAIILPSLVLYRSLLPSLHFRYRGVDCMGINAHPFLAIPFAKLGEFERAPARDQDVHVRRAKPRRVVTASLNSRHQDSITSTT